VGRVRLSHEPTFAAWLKQRRTELNVTREKLSEQVGFSFDLLRKLETGKRRPSAQIALLLADFFKIPADEREAFVTFARSGQIALPAGANPSDDSTNRVRAPWRRAYKHQTNLPASLTPLIGRGQEADTLKELIAHPKARLVTLTGAPGIGKTRLALKVATDLVEQFDDGVFLVELTPVADPGLVLRTIADTLGLKESADQPVDEAVLQHLRERRMLLMLDNFEQVLDASPVVVKLLEASPWLRVLVTSREALHARGERRFSVPPLELPQPNDHPSLRELLSYPSIELFVERARMSRPDFVLTEQNAEAVTRICSALDGLPLAIELAAGHASFFSPQEMEALLGSRLQLLKTRALDLPDRHRTLRGAVEWSYNLLNAQEQTIYRRLGVFTGGFTINAARAVAVAGADGESGVEAVEVLESLLEKSLITRGVFVKAGGAGADGTSNTVGVGRLGMLETLRAYALEQLAAHGEEEETRDRHAHYYLNFVKEGGEHFTGAEVVTWVQQVATEYVNIREALAWFLGSHGRQEGNEGAMEQSAGLHARESKVGKAGSEAELEGIKHGIDLCIALFPFWDAQHYLGEARAWYTLAAERVAPFAQARADGGLLDPEQGTAEITAARNYSPELAAIWATMLSGAGAMAYYQCDYEAARANNEKGLGIRRQIGDRSGMAASLNNLGIAAIDQGDYEAARDYLSESLSIARELGVPWKICSALDNLGIAETRQGELSEARLHLEESLALARQSEDLQRTAEALTNLSVVARLHGEFGEARTYLDQASVIYRQLEHKSGTIQVLIQQGFVAREENHFDKARTHLSEALTLLRDLATKLLIADCLEGLAWLLGKGGNLERSVRLFGAADSLREAKGLPLSQAERNYNDQFLAAARQQLGAERWDMAWAEGRAMTLDHAVADALEV
jgi:predicted ATPase/transcriptional regulator with XRE-family HTH domain